MALLQGARIEYIEHSAGDLVRYIWDELKNILERTNDKTVVARPYC